MDHSGIPKCSDDSTNRSGEAVSATSAATDMWLYGALTVSGTSVVVLVVSLTLGSVLK